VLVAGIWIPQRSVRYSHKGLKPNEKGGMAKPTLSIKTVVTARNLTVNQPMRSEAFDGFLPPIGALVHDQITRKTYWIQPDLERIKAAGGKTRVAVRGRVYLDGRPEAGIEVYIHFYDDPKRTILRTLEAQTDENGQFELPGLVPGYEYQIHANDQAGHGVEKTVRLSELGQDYTDLKIDLTSGLSVTGRVKDVHGKPIPEALIHFGRKTTVKTDAQGRYQANGLYADRL
jgi:hypothetical protein